MADWKSTSGRLTVPDFLNLIGIAWQQKARDAWARCPFHEEKTSSWHITIGGSRAGLWHCFGCQAGGGLVDLLSAIKGVPRGEAGKWLHARGLLGRRIGGAVAWDPDGGWKNQPSIKQRVPPGVRLLRPEDAEAWAYLRGRQVEQRIAEAWQLCWWPAARRVLIPVLAGGRLVDWAARDVTGRAEVRVLSARQLHTGCGGELDRDYTCRRCRVRPSTEGEVWSGKGLGFAGWNGLPRSLPPVIHVAEGSFDALRLCSFGLPTIGVLTNHFTEAQVDALAAHDWQVVLWPDGDAGGDRLVESATQLLACGVDAWVRRCAWGTDPAELLDDGVQALLDAPATRPTRLGYRVQVDK